MVFLLQVVLLKINKGGYQNMSVSETVNANDSNEKKFPTSSSYVQCV